MVLSGKQLVIVTFFLLLQLGACTSIPPNPDGFDSFAEYAESIFRQQNILLSRLMMLSDNEAIQNNDALENAEQLMNDACHLLNEYAERESEGEYISLFFKRKVQSSIENCDRNVRLLDAMLADLQK